jgi:transcription initiation factor TFIIIB Brf1 subunit/transcription initiation factor TFIIB
VQQANQSLKEKANILKPSWECSVCTYHNHIHENKTAYCAMCGSVAPDNAFYSKEEIEKMEEDKQKSI